MNALAALDRAYQAWCRTSPQLILDLWNDAALDEEPAPSLPPCEAGSSSSAPLTPGAEPCHDSSKELTGAPPLGVSVPVVAAPAYGQTEPMHWANGATASASAPSTTTTETGANHCPVTRARLQNGA